MKKIGAVLIGIALTAAVGGAQMMGGGGRGMPGHTPVTDTTPGTGYGGMLPGSGYGAMLGMGGARGAMGAQGLIVTPKGFVIVVRAADSNNDGIPEPEIVALDSAGKKAWNKSLTGLGLPLGVSNDLFLVVEQPTTIDLNKPYATILVAYDVELGTERWNLPVDGIPMNAEPFGGGTYLTVVNRALSTGSPIPGTRFGLGSVVLWAVDTTGKVLWTYDLTK